MWGTGGFHSRVQFHYRIVYTSYTFVHAIPSHITYSMHISPTLPDSQPAMWQVIIFGKGDDGPYIIAPEMRSPCRYEYLC